MTFSRTTNRNRAFTLVELLVVIGIIAVLVGILLPVLGRVRSQANQVTCAAQMRNIVQGLLIYANENRGTMPFSHAWRTAGKSPASGLQSGAPSSSDNFGVISGGSYPGEFWAPGYNWAKSVTDLSNRSGEGGLWPAGPALVAQNGVPPAEKLLKSFVCPEVKTMDYYSASLNSYGFNPVVLVNQPFEVAPNGSTKNYRAGVLTSTLNWSPGGYKNAQGALGGTNYPISPAKLSQLYSDTAVIWDTNVVNGGPPRDFCPANIFGGFGMSGIDGGQMAEPQKPWQRYRNANTAALTEDWELPDRPIVFPTAAMNKLAPQGFQWVNNDPFTGFLAWPDQMGNVRYRHMKNTIANVAFADGSVKSFRVNVNKVAYLDRAGQEVAQSDFLRQYLQIKKPGGLPSPQQEMAP